MPEQTSSEPAPAATPGASQGLRLGSVLGAPVLLAWSWFIAAGVIAVLVSPWVARVRPDLGWLSWVVGLLFSVVLFGSVFLHELAHGVTGRLFGYRVAAIELNVWGGFTRFEPRTEPDSPRAAWVSFTISVIGPVVNLVLGGLGWLVLDALPQGSVPWLLLFGFTFANLILGAINLLPGIPLDGGWALQAVFWRFTGSPYAGTIAAAWFGRLIAVGFVVVALLAPLVQGQRPDLVTVGWTAAIAAMVWFSASDAAKHATQARRVETYDMRRVIQPAIAASWDAPLDSALTYTDPHTGRQPLIVVLDEQGLPNGLVNRQAAAGHAGTGRQVHEFTRPLGPWIGAPADITAPHLLESLTHRPKAAFCLIMQGEALVGFVDLQEFFDELLAH
ncbi:hypothetical protein GCM10009823_09110 [Brevibacterium salitolerans]|uniref:Peptidase M50 domain-containing protein n=1 Tax=Brevibacterium salitolerans TaxID=1403566 RepID=A0ABP5I1J7_9MICO